MKARIIKDHEFFAGEVYADWENPLLDTEWTGWERVTPWCLTKWGAKHELTKWKQENIIDEFEI